MIYIDKVYMHKWLILRLGLNMWTNKFPKYLRCNFDLWNLNGYLLEFFCFFWIEVTVEDATWYVGLLKSPFFRRRWGTLNLGFLDLLQGYHFRTRVAVEKAVWYLSQLRITFLRRWLGTCNLGFLFLLRGLEVISFCFFFTLTLRLLVHRLKYLTPW